MNKKNHIIAATDYSLVSVNACRYALQLAKHINASITFIHVYQFPDKLPDSLSERDKIKKYLSDIESKKIEDFRLEMLESLKMNSHQLETNGYAYEGNVTTEILDEAKRSEADIIVTGTHGAFGFRKYDIGSHTWEIMRKSVVPVFAVPVDSVFRGFKNIVFGTEYDKGEIPVIHFISGLAKLSDGKVTILHISSKPVSSDEDINSARIFQKEIIEKTGFRNFVFTIIHTEKVEEGLDKFCVENGADCLVLSNNISFRIENILPPLFRKAKKLSVNTHVPLLVIPSYYPAMQKKLWELSGLEYNLR